MAKKVTIQGSNLLQNLNDDWGGVNNSQGSVTPYSEQGASTPVPAGAEWGMNRGEVERFIKAQFRQMSGTSIGDFEIVADQNGQNALAGFNSKDAYDEWRALEDDDKWGEAGQQYLLSIVTLPSAEGVDTYSVGLTLQTIPQQIQPTSDVSVNIKGTSVVIYATGGEPEPIQEELVVQIQTRNSTSSPWQTRGEEEVTVQANSDDWEPINLQPYLYTGMNYVRIRAVGMYATSIWRSFSLNVVNLSLVPVMSPQIPFTGDTLSLQYLVGGAVSKNIQFMFGIGTGENFIQQYPDANVDYDNECTQPLGTSINTSTGIAFEFTNENLLFGTNGIMLDGAHTVKARLYASEDVKTDWVEYQYIVNRNASTTPTVVVNNVGQGLENWTEVKFFDWAAYTGGSGSMPVNFILTNEDGTVEYLRWTFTAQNNVNNSFTAQLGIEVSDISVTELYCFMHIEDSEGNSLAEPVFFALSNSATNQPTRGADMIISPSSRDNSEENPARVINAVNGNEITRGSGQSQEKSVFENFTFNTDGWMEVNKDIDDLSPTAEKVRVLRVPANRKLTIPYNPFMNFTSGDNTGRSMTLEIDFRTLNIVDETEPVLRIGTAITGGVWGFEMLATEAYLLTSQMRALDDQNVTWAEDMRTRLSVNVIYNYNQTGLNLARIFLNGIIEREFFYALNDRFTATGGVGIEIGNTACDIEIFGIRCYQKALSSSEVMQDYKATLGSAAEKIAFSNANDIKGQSDTIDWNSCLGKYNIIGHIGHLPKYGDANKGKTTNVKLEIHIVGDDAHSGVLDHLEGSGQGTTAMTYYDWNQQYKITDNTVFTSVAEGVAPTDAGTGYAIEDGEALAKKLVGKINFASSMQSHKIGLTRIYNDLFKHLVGKGQISEPAQMEEYPEARIAVYEKPFLFFHKENESDTEWTFKYLMTFGAGKGDKPTFGFNKNTTGDMLMIEGANNDRPLALFRIPWNEDITYDADEEAWMYNGEKQLNFGFGKTDSNDIPNNTDAINAQKAFFNFVYLHYSRLTPFTGNLSALRASSTVDKTKLYWVTQSEEGSSQYDLYRWDELYNNGRGRWVDAGIAKLGDGEYEKLNLRSQYETFCEELRNAGETAPTETWTVGQWGIINTKIANVRRAHFRKFAENYVHVDDALYHSCFVKFYAGTDNRAKNTYYYTDPSDLKIRFEQDDLDTMIKTNNVGQNRKPYYVEEHDQNQSGEYYWQGESSGFYNLLEEAFESEMTTMMFNMLTGMSEMGGSVMGFHEQFFLSTQDYFPAFAYNEQARLVYENAAVAQAAGIYTNSSAQAITQSVGSQRWSEYQWLKDRIMYISSWCEYGEFAGSSQAPNGLAWRGINGTYSFTLTPAKWLYPRIGSDSGNYIAGADGSKRVRVPAGTAFTYRDITLSSDSYLAIRGINYYFDIGDMNIGLSSQQGTFVFTGRKLQRIRINPNGTDANRFLASRIEISNATNISEFVVRNVSTLSGAIDFRNCARLERIDLRGSGCNSIESSDFSALKYLYLPDTLTSLSLVSPSNLIEFDIEGTQELTSLSITGYSAQHGYELLTQCYEEQAPISTIVLEGEVWQDPNINVVSYVTAIENKNIKLVANFVNTTMTIDMKMELMAAFGDVDDPNNEVYVTYQVNVIQAIAVEGVNFVFVPNTTHKMSLRAIPANGNNVKAIAWSCTNPTYATIDQTGNLTVLQVGTAADQATTTVTCTVTRMDNTPVSASKVVRLYEPQLSVGDYIFSDGSYAPEISGGGGLTAIGRCFYISEDGTDRRAMTLSMAGTAEWGVDGNLTLSTGTLAPYIGVRDAAIGSRVGNKPQGKYNTEVIIARRDLILKDSNINLPVPEEQAQVNGRSVMDNLLSDMLTYSSQKLYYYPAPSICNSYEPTVRAGEVLDNRFKAGNWYLPTLSEIIGFADYNETNNDVSASVERTNFGSQHQAVYNKTSIHVDRGKGTAYNFYACVSF